MISEIKLRIGIFKKYKNLLGNLVSRDIKVRYRRSVLGMLWTVLNPLLMMIVITVVFSTLFKQNIDHFPIYYLSGSLIFSFCSETTSNALYAIIGNASLMKKVYIPKYLFPLSKVLSGLVNLGFSMIAMFGVMLLMKVEFKLSLLLLPIPVFYVFLFSTGLGLLLAAVTVFLWGFCAGVDIFYTDILPSYDSARKCNEDNAYKSHVPLCAVYAHPGAGRSISRYPGKHNLSFYRIGNAWNGNLYFLQKTG